MIIRPEEWIEKPDENGDGFLLAWVVSGDQEYPIPIETHHVAIEDVMLNKEQEFDFILECAEKPDIFLDEDTYYNEHTSSLASESVIPAGLFSARAEKDFVQSPRIILNGKVVKTYDDSVKYGFDEDDILYSLSCLGNEYDVVLHAEHAENINLMEGNIVSCIYWVQGWPREE